MKSEKKRIGFVSTRLAGTDGVSLETEKWVRVLEEMGHACFFFAGELDWPSDRSYVVPEAHFSHPEIEALQVDLFDDNVRSSKTSGKVQSLRFFLKEHLREFIQRFDIDLLVLENALSIPMNVPLGIAITELLAETCIPSIGHHHDFSWERTRFAVNAATDYLRAAFPPVLPSLWHAVINSAAAGELARRTGSSSTLIPNVMDFENPPPPADEYADDMRDEIGIVPGEHFILQPTRIVPRKRIERAIELIRRLDMESALVITHAAGDEGMIYQEYLQDYADLLGVKLIFAADRFGYHRGTTVDGRKIYSLADAYQQAELITYPSTVEGFGNAFLETLYYKRPIVMGTYLIYRIDIMPKGFHVLTIGNLIEEATVNQTREILTDQKLSSEICERNYELGKRYYSYQVLRNRLTLLINESLGANQA